MIVTLSSLLLGLCILAILATVVISFLNRRDYSLLAKIFPFISLPLGLVLFFTKKNYKEFAKILIFGSISGFCYWIFIGDWFLIIYGGKEIMGVFWNPSILIFISIGLIILFEIYKLIMKLVYEGWVLKIKILVLITSLGVLSFSAPITNIISLIFSEEFIFISPYLFISDGNIIDAMFLYLIELLGTAYIGINIRWWRNLIINIINKGWKYIMKLLMFIACLGIVSIYPLLFYNNITDFLFDYLYVFLFLSVSFLFLSGIYIRVIRINKDGWNYIKEIFIQFGIGFVIGLLAYLLADGSIDPKSLKYGVTTIIARLAGAGGNIVIAYIILILTSITVLEIRTLVFKSSN